MGKEAQFVRAEALSASAAESLNLMSEFLVRNLVQVGRYFPAGAKFTLASSTSEKHFFPACWVLTLGSRGESPAVREQAGKILPVSKA